MLALWLLIKKNLKLLLRSKSSALIVIFAPLLIILVLGLSYNTSSKFGLNIGIYSPSFTDDVNSLIELLQEQEFKIVKYSTSIDECLDDIKAGFVHTCISVPESLKVEGNTPKEIIFYLDPSRINLVWMIQETLKTKFDLKSEQISQELTQQILTRMTDTKNEIVAKKNDLAAAKEKSSSAASSTDSVRSILVAIDLTPPAASYNTSGFIENVGSGIGQGKNKIADAITAVSGAEINATEKTKIKLLLEDASKKLDGAVSYLNGSDSSSVKWLINALETDLNAAKNKLTTAAGTISSSNAGLESTVASLKESISALENIQTALNEIQNNLESQSVTEASTIASPLVTKIESVGKESTYLDYLFPALLVVVIMFSSLLLGTTLVMMEKNSPAFLRNFFLPLRKTTFIISIYLTNLILMLVQIAIILGISLFFLKEALPFFPAIALVLFFSASVFTFLGMAIGYVFTSEETAVLASISLGSIFLFVSGVILPIESISPLLREIMSFNPFVLSEKIIRETFFFSASLKDLGLDLAILAGYALILFLLIVIIESLLYQHLLQRFWKHFHQRPKAKEG